MKEWIKYHLPAIVIVAIIALLPSWQIIKYLNTHFLGRPFEDAVAAMWLLSHALKAIVDPNLTPTFTQDVYYPFGYYTAGDAQSIWWAIFVAPLTYFLGLLATYNTVLLGGLVLAGIGIYLLVERLTTYRLSGIVAATIYTSVSVITIRLRGHVNVLLAAMCLPYLVLLTFLALKENDRKRGWLLAGLAGLMFTLTALSSWYFVFIGLVAVISLVLLIESPIPLKIRLERGFIIGLVFLVSISPFLKLTIDANLAMFGQITEFNPLGSDGLSMSSDRILLPKVTHTIWGGSLRQHFPDTGESTSVSLGYVAIFLAIIGLWKTKFVKTRAFLAIFLIGTVLAMGITLHWNTSRVILKMPDGMIDVYLSLTAWLTGDITGEPVVPLPSLLLSNVVPFFSAMRAWSRFMIVATLALAVLAGHGARFLATRYKNGVFLVALFIPLILLEGLEAPYGPFTKVADIQRPVDLWLAEQPPGTAIIEYPWPYANKLALFRQTIHGQPIVNGIAPNQPDFLNQAPEVLLVNPQAETVPTLREWNIRYLLFTSSTDDERLATLREITDLCWIQAFPATYQESDLFINVFQVLDEPGTVNCPRH